MKYILFETINIVNNYIYIGVHGTDAPNLFDGYLGDGIYTNKPNTYEKSKTALQQAVKQYGCKNFKRNIISIYNDEESAWNAYKSVVVNSNYIERPDIYNIYFGEPIIGFTVYKYDKFGSYIDKEKTTYETYLAAILGTLVKDSFYYSFLQAEEYNQARTEYCKIRPVYQYSSEGKFVMAYDSQTEAEELNKKMNISKAIKFKTPDKQGFYWSLNTRNYFNIPLPKKHRVAKVLNDKIIKTWESVSECIKEEGSSIKNVLRGKADEYNGFVYKYIS